MKRIAIFTIVALQLISLPTRAANPDPFTPPKIKVPVFRDKTYDVKDFGAVGDGVANDTPAINAAIAKANAEGGGTVHFPAGKYAAASIHLKSNIRLHLDKDA